MLTKSYNAKYVVHIMFVSHESGASNVYFFGREEFLDIARWVAGMKVDAHVVDVLYELLDEDTDNKISAKEFSTVLFQWRNTRGFQHSSVQLTLGQLKI